MLGQHYTLHENEDELREIEKDLAAYLDVPFVKCEYDAVNSHKYQDKHEVKYRETCAKETECWDACDYIINYELYKTKEDYDKNSVKTHHYIVRDEMTDWGLPNVFKEYEIDPNTLCRCTGCHDKNGNLIFENDILNGKLYNIVSYGNGENEFLGMNVGWYVQRDNFESWCELNDLGMYEVTGNILKDNI